MYAVIRTGGKQYKVGKDSILKVESLTGDVGSKLDLEVLMLGGDKPQIGAPLPQSGLFPSVVAGCRKACRDRVGIFPPTAELSPA